MTTTDPRPLSAEERIERGYATIHALCTGKLRWEMRVPAEPDHDPDLILTDALGAARELLDAERARHAALDVDRLEAAFIEAVNAPSKARSGTIAVPHFQDVEAIWTVLRAALAEP